MASSPEFQSLFYAHKETAGAERLAEVSSPPKRETSAKEIGTTHTKNKSKTSLDDNQLIKQEERELGDTGFKPYIQYLNQNKGFLFFSLACFCQLAYVTGQTLQNCWKAANGENPDVTKLRLITVYLVIRFASIVFLLGRSLYAVALGLH